MTALLVGCGLLAGCDASPPDLGSLMEGAPIVEGTGDWNDVRAAVLLAAEQSDMAIAHVYEPEPDRRLFRLQTVRSERAWLEVVRMGMADGGVEIRMRARIGRFGDPERERALMSRVAERLKRLSGVDYRPIS